MEKQEDKSWTSGFYHYKYFKEMIKHRSSYNKKIVGEYIMADTYLEELKIRINETEHLSTLQHFFDVVELL